jgi:virginiamycin B lyase
MEGDYMRRFLNANWVATAALSALLAFWGPSGAAAHVYWTNEDNGTMGRANIDGSGVNEAFIPSVTGGAAGGAGMTVNNEFIYWTSANGGTATHIRRANLNGTGVIPNFIKDAVNPCGVTVDSHFIYWSGDGGDSIGRANLNGTGVIPNFIFTGTVPANGVCGVVVTATHIFWANYRASSIGKANIDGTNVNPNFITGTGGAGGLAIGIGADAVEYIYWPSNGGTAIGRAKHDGTGVNQNFITGLNGAIAFIAVDSAHIYWADVGEPLYTGTTIWRANLDGTGVNQTFITGTKGGFGIAVTGGSP